MSARSLTWVILLASSAVLLAFGSATCYLFRGMFTAEVVASPSESLFDDDTPARVDDFALRDSFGNETTFAALRQQHSLLAVVFWGCDCPLVRLYAKTLSDLSAELASQGVAILGINSNVQDSATAITRFIEVEDVKFPIYKDAGNRIADQFHAARTPEAFLVDAQGNILYRGRIDDQFGIGYRKNAPEHHFLKDAIIAALAGKPISTPRTEAVGCLIGRATKPTPTGDVTYSKQISRLLQRRCEECHRDGEIAPFPLTTYEQAYGWAEMMREVVEQERMPPWFATGTLGHFKNDSRLTPEEKQLLNEWIDNGCPQGDPNDLPPPAEFLTGWNIPQPDVVYKIADTPVKVPARGPFDYQNFYIQTNFDEDKWIVAAEARPGNRKVVHHIAIWILRDGMPKDDYSTSPPISFAPGMPALAYPEGTALLLPKGATFRYQIHYEPCGYETEDLSTLGLVFCPPEAVKAQVMFDAVFPNDPIDIPPRDPAYKLLGYHYFARDALLFGLMPHMHLRGKEIRYTLVHPDQRRETLLDIPRWDFGWQFWYLLPQPVNIVKGSVLETESIFDNSPDNPANPDATQEVRWGPQTTDEMTVGVFAAIDPLSQAAENPALYFPPREGFNAPAQNDWVFKNHDGGTGHLIPGPHPYAPQKIAIEKPADKPWKVQLLRPVAPITKGRSYNLSFRVKSSKPRPISFGVCQSKAPYDNLGLFKTIDVGTDLQYQRYEFYATQDAEHAEIRFDLAAGDGEIELDSVVLLQGFHR